MASRLALEPSTRPISRRAAVSALSALPAATAIRTLSGALSGTLAGTLSIALGACQRGDSALVTVSEAQQALPAGLDPAIVRSIGQAWLAAHPTEATPAAISSALREAQHAHRQWPWQPLPPITDVLRAEYAAGTTELPDGWVIAPSEARCCARVVLG